jgi:large subunit ribosomal protein L28
MRCAAGRCEICGKGAHQRNLVSHSKRHSLRYAIPNLRRVRAQWGKTIERRWVCTKCLKRGLIRRALPRRVARAAAAS